MRAAGDTVREYEAGYIRGVVPRGPYQQPAPGVVIAINDVDAWTESDSTGAFEIGPLIEGPYSMVVHDDDLTQVGRSLPSVPVVVSYQEPTTRNIHLEDPEEVLVEYCGRRRDFSRTAVLVGRTRVDGGTRLIEDVEVRVRWTDPLGRSGDRKADSNEHGFYYVCGVSRGTQVTVTTKSEDIESAPQVLQIPEGATAAVLDLLVETTPSSPPGG